MALSRHCGRTTLSGTHLVLATGDVHPPGRSDAICANEVVAYPLVNHRKIIGNGDLPFGKLAQKVKKVLKIMSFPIEHVFCFIAKLVYQTVIYDYVTIPHL